MIIVAGFPMLYSRQYALFLEEEKIIYLIPEENQKFKFIEPFLKKDKQKLTEIQKENKKFRTLKIGKKNSITLHYYKGLKKFLNETKPELVFSSIEPSYLSTAQLCYYCKKMKIPFVFYTWENINKKYVFPINIMEKYVLKNSKYAVCANQKALDVIKIKGFKGDSLVLPHTVIDKNFFKKIPLQKNKFGLKNKKVILYLGRLVKEKGIMTLVKNAKTINQKIPKVYFYIVGKGPEKENIESEFKKQKIKNYKILDWIQYAKVPEIMSLADVFIYLSKDIKEWQEQFGAANIEAQMVGIPVITTNAGSIPEVVKDTAVVLDQNNNDQSLVEAIEKILTNKTYSTQLIKKGTLNSKRYEKQNVKKQYMAFFEKIIRIENKKINKK
jgi:glycosyltransferase involved in cell wall biosynthesis